MNMIKHIKVWNIWRKKSLNAPFFKLLVLLTIAKSPTFQLEKVFYGVDASRGFIQGFDLASGPDFTGGLLDGYESIN